MSKHDKKVQEADPFSDDVVPETNESNTDAVDVDDSVYESEVVDSDVEPLVGAAELHIKNDEIAQLKEELLRKQAEFVNLERRHEKAVADAAKYSVKKIVEALLPVLDGFHHALTHGEPKDNPEALTIYSGLSMSADILNKVLMQQGIEEISPAIGDDFDPQVHEAITMQKDTEYPSGSVLAVVQAGYRLHDRVIRAARVVVNE